MHVYWGLPTTGIIMIYWTNEEVTYTCGNMIPNQILQDSYPDDFNEMPTRRLLDACESRHGMGYRAIHSMVLFHWFYRYLWSFHLPNGVKLTFWFYFIFVP
jgi:hypothetical protein